MKQKAINEAKKHFPNERWLFVSSLNKRGIQDLRNIIEESEAGCPDQVCVHQGFIADGTVPIVCLPNKLIIEISGGGDRLDAATG